MSAGASASRLLVLLLALTTIMMIERDKLAGHDYYFIQAQQCIEFQVFVNRFVFVFTTISVKF